MSKTVSGQTTVYVYDAFGNLAAEYGPPTASPCGTSTCYLTTDHLGSTRLLTDNVGSSTNVKRYDFLPFGEEIVAPVNGRSTSMGYPSSPDALLEKFTGHARDTETANINSMTGMDWMRARYYSSSQGRFQSVDPANAGASVGDPQSWNGYAYVGNNPLNYTDPDGTIALQATAAGASIAGPVGAAVGLGVDIACAIFCAKMFGGQSLPAPKITGNGPEVWSERAPISGGGVNTGSVYGSGCGMTGICSFGQIKSVSTAAAFSTWDVPYLPPLRRSAKGSGKTPPSCPAVPAHPSNASLTDNIRLAEQSVYKIWAKPRLEWFRNQVKNKGPWDYKQQGKQYEAFGNFNFGVTGAAAGIQSQLLLRAAGQAQSAAKTSRPEFGNWYDFRGPFGDDPADQQEIARGIAYYNAGCR